MSPITVVRNRFGSCLIQLVVAVCICASLGAQLTAQTNTSNAQQYFNQAETYLGQKNFTAAIPYYKAAIAADPSMAAAHYALGLCYYETKTPKLAAESFKTY